MDIPDKIYAHNGNSITSQGSWDDLKEFVSGPVGAEYVRSDLAQSLADALEWYLENDDTNMEDPNNGFYIEGNNRARAALANYRKGE